MKQKGFTLIELLVVVAIIGVLVTVGTVSYSSFISSAKIKATETQHKKIADFIEASLTKCKLSKGASVDLVKYSGDLYLFDCSTNDLGIWRNAFFNHFVGLGWKNPYNAPSPWDVNNNRPLCCMPYNDNPYIWKTGVTSIGTSGDYLIVYTDIDGVEGNRITDRIKGLRR